MSQEFNVDETALDQQVSPRRSISDPTVSSPGERNKRTPTPFPIPNKPPSLPSKIPRFAGGGRQQIEIIKSKKAPIRRGTKTSSTSIKTSATSARNFPATTKASLTLLKYSNKHPSGLQKNPSTSLKTLNASRKTSSTSLKTSSTSLKTAFYPSKQPSSSTTTVLHPRELVVTPSDDESSGDCRQIFTPPSPRRQIRLPPKPALICRSLDNPTRPHSSSQRPSSGRRPSRGQVLDSEGHVQGPHTHHNKHIDYVRPPRSVESAQQEDRGDRGDFLGLPPLPPTFKKPPSRARLGTAIISQGNTVLEGHFQLEKPRRSDLYSALPLAASSPRRHGIIPPSNYSSTSLIFSPRVHEAASVTNLEKKLYSETELQTIAKCPLCSAARGQCHLHHRTMSSRYLTDLEWRICHAVNIYVYKNGEEGQTPILVHIPPSKKKNMKSVMNVIQERISYPIGYAKYLYRMNGKKVASPCELEMYNNYVVASNYDKCFKPVCYARRRSPLLVLAKESKHVRELRLRNYQYELYLARKRALGEERPGLEENSPAMYQISTAFHVNNQHQANQDPAMMQGSEIGCNFRVVQTPAIPLATTRVCPKKKQRIVLECTGDSRQPYEYSVQNCTISTAQLKNPSDASVEAKKKIEECSSSGRFKAIYNENESVFYSSRKPSKGVIDASGTKKIFLDQSQIEKPCGDSDFEEIHKPKYDPITYTAMEDSEVEGYFRANTSQTLSEPKQQFSRETNNAEIQPSRNSLYQGTGDAGQSQDSKSQSHVEYSTTPDRSAMTAQGGQMPSQNQVPVQRQNQTPVQSTNQVPVQSQISMPEPTTAMSGPSRSYTILTPVQVGPTYGSYTERVVYKASGTEPTVGPPSRLGLHNPPPTGPSVSVPNEASNQFYNQRFSPQMYPVNGTQYYIPKHQSYSYFGQAQPEYYRQPYMYQPPQAPLVNQYEPVNQRINYGTLIMDPRRVAAAEPTKNPYSSDEVDIPYTPPMYYQHYQGTESMQHQVFTENSNQLGPNRDALKGAGLVTIRKPSRRNVAIQMGEPSTLEDGENDSALQENLQINAGRMQYGSIVYSSPPKNPMETGRINEHTTPRPRPLQDQQQCPQNHPHSQDLQNQSQQQSKHLQLYHTRQQILHQQRVAQQCESYNQQLQFDQRPQRQCPPRIQDQTYANQGLVHHSFQQADQNNNYEACEDDYYTQDRETEATEISEATDHQPSNQNNETIQQRNMRLYQSQNDAITNALEYQQSGLQAQHTLQRQYALQYHRPMMVAQGSNSIIQARAHGSNSGAVVPPPTRYRDSDGRNLRPLQFQNATSFRHVAQKDSNNYCSNLDSNCNQYYNYNT